MNMKMFNQKKMIRLISLALLQTFLLYNTTFASVEARPEQPQNAMADGITAGSINTIGVPKDIGSVKSRYAGNGAKIIIHIQDAHCNYEAQTNIAKMLEHLIKKYNVNFVAVEGADGVVDTTWF